MFGGLGGRLNNAATEVRTGAYLCRDRACLTPWYLSNCFLWAVVAAVSFRLAAQPTQLTCHLLPEPECWRWLVLSPDAAASL